MIFRQYASDELFLRSSARHAERITQHDQINRTLSGKIGRVITKTVVVDGNCDAPFLAQVFAARHCGYIAKSEAVEASVCRIPTQVRLRRPGVTESSARPWLQNIWHEGSYYQIANCNGQRN